VVVIEGVHNNSSLPIPSDDASVIADDQHREGMSTILSAELSTRIACYLAQCVKTLLGLRYNRLIKPRMFAECIVCTIPFEFRDVPSVYTHTSGLTLNVNDEQFFALNLEISQLRDVPSVYTHTSGLTLNVNDEQFLASAWLDMFTNDN
jgi:hypothetical protein